MAIIPTEEFLISPFEGIVKQISSNKHIIIIKSQEGFDVLIHLGIDSLQVDSQSIECYVTEGDCVKAGDRLLKFNLDELKAKSKSIVTPVIFTNLKEDQYIYYKFKSRFEKVRPLKIYICKK